MNEPAAIDDLKLTPSFWLCLVLLFLAVLAFHAKTLPFSNEFAYLLRLQPNFLPNDWTFSTPAHEHWLFNLIFSVPSRFLSLETAGWVCRIASWIALLFALIKLGKYWQIAYWKIAVSLFLWLAIAQAVVNEEWIFGGFEAKVVAYICLLFSLVGFSRRDIIIPSVLLGLTFGFHPAVGLWAILGVGLAFLLERIPIKDLAKVVVITGLIALLGSLPLIAEQLGTSAGSADDWKFIVIYRTSAILDVFQFSKAGTILIFAMLAFNCVALWKDKNFALRFLLKFQIALGLFFVAGIVLRWLEMFPFLRLMPMRLFPVFTPLFFMWTAFYTVQRLTPRQHKIIIALFAVLVVGFLDPLGKGYMQIQQTLHSRAAAPDDFQQASRWISQNTPAEAVVIQPPNRTDFWYFARRAGVVSFGYPTFDRLPEWRTRVSDLTGNRQISKGESAYEEIENAFNQLSSEQAAQLKNKYAAAYLVSCGVYPYPILFKTETYKVYQLP